MLLGLLLGIVSLGNTNTNSTGTTRYRYIDLEKVEIHLKALIEWTKYKLCTKSIQKFIFELFPIRI